MEDPVYGQQVPVGWKHGADPTDTEINPLQLSSSAVEWRVDHLCLPPATCSRRYCEQPYQQVTLNENLSVCPSVVCLRQLYSPEWSQPII